MKKAIVLLLAALLCVTMVLPVCAAAQEFVPSITYKDAVKVKTATMDGEDVDTCIVITSIKDANDKTTDIEQASRDALLDVYAKLNDGTMKLPLEGDYVIRELVDISFAKSACKDDPDHEHDQWLCEDDASITLSLTSLAGAENLVVLCYKQDKWNVVEDAKLSADGTVTCVFEHFCPVAFCVQSNATTPAPTTGDSGNVFLWMALMLAAAVALVAVLVVGRRRLAE